MDFKLPQCSHNSKPAPPVGYLVKSELKQLVGLLECSDSTHEYYGIANEIFAREERDINLEALKRYGKNLLDRLQT